MSQDQITAKKYIAISILLFTSEFITKTWISITFGQFFYCCLPSISSTYYSPSDNSEIKICFLIFWRAHFSEYLMWHQHEMKREGRHIRCVQCLWHRVFEKLFSFRFRQFSFYPICKIKKIRRDTRKMIISKVLYFI